MLVTPNVVLVIEKEIVNYKSYNYCQELLYKDVRKDSLQVHNYRNWDIGYKGFENRQLGDL